LVERIGFHFKQIFERAWGKKDLSEIFI